MAYMNWQQQYWGDTGAGKSITDRENATFNDKKLQEWAAVAQTRPEGYMKVIGPSNNHYAVYPDGSYYPLLGNGSSLRDVIQSGQPWERRGHSVNVNGKNIAASSYQPEGSGNSLGNLALGAMTGGLSGGLTGSQALGNVLTGTSATEGLGTTAALDAAGLAAAVGGTALMGSGGLGGVGAGGLEQLAGPGFVEGAGSAPSLGGGLSLGNIANLGTIGQIGGGLLGVLGSNQQKNEGENIAGGLRADRLPYLEASQEWLADPNKYFEGPGKASLDAVLRRLSVNGNPIGSGTSMALATEAGLNDWRNAVTGFGNLGLGGQGLQAQAQQNAATAGAGRYDALGGVLADVTQSKTDLASILKSMGFTGAAA